MPVKSAEPQLEQLQSFNLLFSTNLIPDTGLIRYHTLWNKDVKFLKCFILLEDLDVFLICAFFMHVY